jgi:hypothetical protein
MRLTRAILAVSILLTTLQVGPAPAAPQPSDVTAGWELGFTYENPQAIRVQLPGMAVPETFWYIRYSVTNDTGQDRLFIPEFVMYTDTGQVVRAGKGVPPAVFTHIKRMYNDPLLKDQTGMTGKLLQGADNSKRGLAIFRDFDPNTGMFDVFIGGLTGETVQVALPKPIEVEVSDPLGRTRKVLRSSILLTKTRHLKYLVPGEAGARATAGIRRIHEGWVMR